MTNLTLAGQTDRDTALFERLPGPANDLGLLEEVDPASGELLLGNWPRPSATSG